MTSWAALSAVGKPWWDRQRNLIWFLKLRQVLRDSDKTNKQTNKKQKQKQTKNRQTNNKQTSKQKRIKQKQNKQK